MILLETRMDSECIIDEDCKVLGNAICDPTGTCRCDRAHFAPDRNTKCIPGNINVTDTILQIMIFRQLMLAELGEFCDNNDVSYIQNSICRGGRWSCTKGTVASKDNRECLNGK